MLRLDGPGRGEEAASHGGDERTSVRSGPPSGRSLEGPDGQAGRTYPSGRGIGYDFLSPLQAIAGLEAVRHECETLFEEFCHLLRAEKEAAPHTIETYRWFFKDYGVG